MSPLPPNPFDYGKTVEKTSFFDRVEEQRILKEDFSKSQNVILMAPRRYGKSSLIKKVLGQLNSREFLTLYIDLFDIDSVAHFASVFGHALTKTTDTPLKKIGSFFKEWAPHLKPKILIQGDNLPEFSFDWESAGQTPQKGLGDLFDMFYQYCKKKKLKGVVVFDEFQEILQWGDKALLKQIRASVQSHENIAYCFAGSKRHLLSQLFLKEASPLFHCGKIFSLKKIPRKDFFAFLKKSFLVMKSQNVEELSEQILNFADCHPYYTQMLAYHYWQQVSCDPTLKLKDILAIILQLQNDAFVSLWNLLTKRQKKLLTALAHDECRPLSQVEVMAKWDLGSSATVTKVVKNLEMEGFAEKNDTDNLVVADPFFKLWISKRNES